MIATIRNRLVVAPDRLGRVLSSFMVIGFAALVAVGIAAGWVTGRNEEHSRWVNHTYEVELAIGTVRRLIEQTEASRRGYLLTGTDSYRVAYQQGTADMPGAVRQLAVLTRDNPLQQRAITRLRTSLGDLLVQRAQTMTLIDAGRADTARSLFEQETAAHRLQRIRALFDVMTTEERRLLAERDQAQRATLRAFYAVLAVAAVLLLVVAILALLIVLRYTRDLAQSRDNLRRFNDQLEETVSERTADLSRANEEIQRFAYIVSHDLRSPLVNVMGFTAELATATTPLAELVDRAEAECPHIVTEEARLAAREDLPEAIGFIRTSTQKMDRLINAILKLSREGRRVITPEPLDPAIVVDAIGGSIRHLLDDRGVALTIQRPMPTIVTDRVALEQILSNLIENATKYLSPGRPGTIDVCGSVRRGRVILSVSDNGRGIDPRDHQRIFDLFRRSGQQDQPGEGIGLAHVRALAYRLGGTIDVESELGRGSTFRINLPQNYEAQDSKA